MLGGLSPSKMDMSVWDFYISLNDSDPTTSEGEKEEQVGKVERKSTKKRKKISKSTPQKDNISSDEESTIITPKKRKSRLIFLDNTLDLLSSEENNQQSSIPLPPTASDNLSSNNDSEKSKSPEVPEPTQSTSHQQTNKSKNIMSKALLNPLKSTTATWSTSEESDLNTSGEDNSNKNHVVTPSPLIKQKTHRTRNQGSLIYSPRFRPPKSNEYFYCSAFRSKKFTKTDVLNLIAGYNRYSHRYYKWKLIRTNYSFQAEVNTWTLKDLWRNLMLKDLIGNKNGKWFLKEK